MHLKALIVIAMGHGLCDDGAVKVACLLVSWMLYSSLACMAGGSVMDDLGIVPAATAKQQSLFGAPDIQFASKKESDWPLGYVVGSASYTYRASADFDSLPGEVSSEETRAFLPFLALNQDEYHLFAWLYYGSSRSDFRGDFGLLSQETLEGIYVPIVFVHDVSSDWVWGGMIMPGMTGDGGSDGMMLGAALALGYAWNENLEVFAGVYAQFGYGNDFAVPGVGFIWRPAPRWQAYLLPPIGGVNYSINDQWLVGLYGRYTWPTWYVEGNGVAPDRYVKLGGMQFGVRVEGQLYKALWGFAGAGVSVGQGFEVEDLSNKSLFEEDIELSPYLQLGINLRF